MLCYHESAALLTVLIVKLERNSSKVKLFLRLGGAMFSNVDPKVKRQNGK